jgi:dihydropteroate synthase
MQRTHYVRPIGLMAARRDGEYVDFRGALPLAHGLFDFTGVELIERLRGTTTRRIAGLSDLSDLEWGRRIEQSLDLFDALLGARPQLGRLGLERPRLMGIVNVTPDSFSDGGRHATREAAISHGLALAAAGADILDIGGESTRPGAVPVPVAEELARVLPVLEGLAGRTSALLSVDTRKAEVAARAIEAGADLVNDVSALAHDPEMAGVLADAGKPVILMHALADPATMQDAPHYDDVLLDVYDTLATRLEKAVAAGIPRERLLVDPGLGFGKTLAHNLALLAGLSLFHGLGVPIVVGASRKRFVGHLTDRAEPAARMAGSLGAALAAAAQGAQVLRVHDVAETRQALDVWVASLSGRVPAGLEPTAGAGRAARP